MQKNGREGASPSQWKIDMNTMNSMNIFKTVITVSIGYNENIYFCPMIYIDGSGKLPQSVDY